MPICIHYNIYRSSLSTCNKAFLTGFLEENGIYILMKCIDERIVKLPMTDLDASILYEILCCCKSIMNNDTGKIHGVYVILTY